MAIIESGARRDFKRRIRHIPVATVTAMLAGETGSEPGVRSLDDSVVRVTQTLPERTVLLAPNPAPGGESIAPTAAATMTIKVIDRRPAHPPIRLGDFTPGNTEGAELLARHYAGRYVDLAAAISDPSYQAERKRQYMLKHPKMTEADVDARFQQQAERISRRLDERVYRTIQQEHGEINGASEAITVFNSAEHTADAAVRRHAELVFPSDTGAILLDEVAGGQSPSQLLQGYFGPSVDERKKFEIERKFLLTDIAMQERHHYTDTAERKLEQLQTFLRERFYKDKDTEGKPVSMPMWGIFDDRTNALITGENNTPQFLHGEPQADAPVGVHYKKINVQAMELEDGGHIAVIPNIKKEEDAVRKPLRKAMSRKGNPDDSIDVERDMQDTHRMKIVVIGTQEDSDRFSERLFDELMDPANGTFFYDHGAHAIDENGIPLGAPTGKGEIQYGAKPGPGKSPERVNYTKLMLEYAGIKNPVKIVVQPVHSYMTEQLETGSFNPDKGKMDGPAWEMVALQRELPLAEVLAPTDIYPGEERHEPGRETPHPALAAKVEELLTSRELTLAA